MDEEQLIQLRLKEISTALDIISASKAKIGQLSSSAGRLVRGADQAYRRTDLLLAGSAHGVDRHVGEKLKETVDASRLFQRKLDEIEMQIAKRKHSLEDEREHLGDEIRKVREAQRAERS